MHALRTVAKRPASIAWLAALPLAAVAVQVVLGGVDLAPFVIAELIVAMLFVVSSRDLASRAAKQDRRMTALLSKAVDAFTVAAPDGTIVYVSPASERVTGMPAGQSLGRSIYDFMSRVDADDLAGPGKDLLAALTDPGAEVTRQLRVQDVGGTERCLQVTVRNRVEDPDIRGIVLHYQDVSEARRAADQLRIQADILASVRESVIATDLAGQVTYWGPGAAAIFGYAAEDMLGRTLDVIYPVPVEGAADDLAGILAGADYEGEWQGRRRDGSMIWLQVHTAVMRDQSGQPVGFIGVASETTERREWQAQLTRLGAVVEQSSESVMIANTDAEIEYVNPAFERITGWGREEVIGKNPRILQSGDHPPSFYRAMWATLTAGKPWVADLSNRRKDGTPFTEEAVVFPIRDESGAIDGYASVKRDVTEQRRLEASGAVQLRERALIAETMRAISGRETPEETAVAICLQVASLAEVASAGLFIFELDGRATQYGFVVDGRPSPPVSRVPRRRTAHLLEQASRGPWIERWDDRPWHPYNDVFMEQGVQAVAYAPVRDGATVIGFLHIASAAPNAEAQLVDRLPALVQFADIASSLIGPEVAARTEVAAVRESIELVIRDGAFEPTFQPIVDIMRDEIVGYEALTRFADGVAADVRFAEAASVGLGEQLELATLRAALQASTSLPPGVWLNVNTSPQLVVRDEQLAPLIAAIGRDLVLEVTEHAAVADYAAFRGAVERLGPRVRIAVDDAGAGFASLRHILELKPAFVKLDRGLIEGIDRDDARRALVAGLRHFTSATGMQLIAEGVETKAELAALRELDVHLAQGYLLGRPERIGHPIPAPAFIKRVGAFRNSRRHPATEGAPLS